MAREPKRTVIRPVEPDKDLLKELVRDAAGGPGSGNERSRRGLPGTAKALPSSAGYRSGYYVRSLVTRVGKLELRVPRDRDARFSTEVFERFSRVEKAFVGALVEMYVQGVSTRKAKVVTEELCGHEFSPSAVSR